MTWFPFRAQAALDRTGTPRESGVGNVYAIDDVTFSTPLTVREIGGGAVLPNISVVQFLTQEFEVEDHEEVYWRSGTAPAVHLISAKGMADAARAAQAAAEAAAAAVAGAGEATDETVAFWLDSAGSQTRAAGARVFGAQVSARSMGAVGDGVANDGPAIQAAIDAVHVFGGGVVLLDGAGTFRTEQTIHLKSNVTLRGDGASTLDYSAVPKSGSARFGIRATGTVGSQTPLTTTAARGGTTVQVGSTAGFTAGAWVMLATSGVNHYPYGGSTLVDRGEIKRVRSTTGTSLGFEQANYDRYDIGHSPWVAPIAMVRNVAVENLRIMGSGVADAGDRAIQFDYVDGFHVRGCVIEATDVYCVQLNGAIRGDVSHNRMRGVHYDGTTGQVFYAVSVMNASQWIRVADNHAEQVRHLFVTSANSQGQGFWGMPRFITCIGNVAQNMQVAQSGRSWAFEHHGFGDAILIVGNIADGCYGGFCARGPGVTFEGNIVRNWWQNGLEIHAQTVDARNIIVRNNQVSDRIIAGGGATDPTAIRVSLDNATTVRNVVVEGNVVEVDTTSASVAGGLHATGTHAEGLSVRGNRFTWVGSGEAPSWLVRTFAPGTIVKGNEIIGSQYGIRVTGADSDVVENHGYVTAQKAIGNLVYVDAANCIVQGNRSRRMRYCVQSAATATGVVLTGNVGQSDADPFGLGTTTGLNAKVNAWQGGTTAVNN